MNGWLYLDETRLGARQETFKFIEMYCNTTRPHSSMGNLSPIEYERKIVNRSLLRSHRSAPFLFQVGLDHRQRKVWKACD